MRVSGVSFCLGVHERYTQVFQPSLLSHAQSLSKRPAGCVIYAKYRGNYLLLKLNIIEFYDYNIKIKRCKRPDEHGE